MRARRGLAQLGPNAYKAAAVSEACGFSGGGQGKPVGRARVAVSGGRDAAMLRVPVPDARGKAASKRRTETCQHRYPAACCEHARNSPAVVVISGTTQCGFA